MTVKGVQIAGLIVAVAFFLVPPMGRAGTYGRTHWRGYRFLFGSDAHGLVTDWGRLALQYAILGAIVYVAFNASKDKTS